MGEDPEIDCSRICLYSWDNGKPIDRDVQRSAFDVIYSQLWDCLNAAYQNREDRWQACRIIINAEKLVSMYTAEGYFLLQPLADVLHDLFRVERRLLIRRALLCREEHRPIYKEALRKWDCDADAADDFRVVERALNESANMFEDLRRRWAV
jgi:hypothetical protein